MDNSVASPSMLLLSPRPLNEDNQQLACRWRGCQDANRLFCPQSLYDHLCQAHASSSYAALGLTQDLSVGTGGGSPSDADSKSGEIGEGVACLWEGCQYRCKSKKRHHMNSHLRSHVPLSPYHCPICAVTFKWKSDLTKHLRRQHDITGPATNQATSADDNALETGPIMSDEMGSAPVANMGIHDTKQLNALLRRQLQANMPTVVAAGNGSIGINGHSNEIDAAQMQANREHSISVLRHFIQVVREGQLQPHTNDPALAVWGEELSKLDLATIKPLLESNPEVLQMIESFLDVMNAESGTAAIKTEMSTSPQAVTSVDNMAFLTQNNISPPISADGRSIASSSAAMAVDAFNGGVPLTAPLGSMSGLFAMEQSPSMYTGNGAGITYPNVTSPNNPAGIANAAAAVAAMTNSPHSGIFSPPAQTTPLSLLSAHQNPQQASPSPHIPSMSPSIDENLLFGSSLDNSSFVYSPPARIDEGPVTSPDSTSIEAQMAAASQLDVAQYNWLMAQEYPMGIESAMGVQPSEIFGAMSSTNALTQQIAANPQAQMLSWTNQLRQTNTADERSLRRVQSTPVLMEHAQQRPTIRSPGSPSMLRPMRSTELRTRMVSPSRSTERAPRPAPHTSRTSLLRASQSVDALRIHAVAAAAAAAAQSNPTIPEHGSAPDFSAANVGMVGVSSPTSPAMQMDKRANGRGRLDTVLHRMQQLTLRNPTGVTGQVRFKRSPERVRWQGQ